MRGFAECDAIDRESSSALQHGGRDVGRRDEGGYRNILRRVLVFGADESPDAGDAHRAEDYAAGEADPSEAVAGGFAGGDAPLGREEPDAVGEVPADGDHGDDVDRKHDGMRELLLDLPEGGVGMLRQADPGEALTPDVLADVEEGDEAGPALGGVHPIAGPGVVDDVGLAAQPDIDAVDAVIEEGKEDEDPLEHAHERQAVEEPDLLTVGDGALEGFKVREQVLEEECADGNDAEERVQAAPDEGVSLAGAERLHACARFGRSWMLGGGHEELLSSSSRLVTAEPRVSD